MKHESKRKAQRCAARPGGRLDWRRAAFLAMLVCPWAWGGADQSTGLPTVSPTTGAQQGELAMTIAADRKSLTITQTSNRAVIEWSDFSIRAGKSVEFKVPSPSAITLNKVVGSERSNIEGTLTSSGQVWLLNPKGVLIGPTGSINTAGFLASTHQLWDTSKNAELDNNAFLQGNNSFTLSNPDPDGRIENQGSITAMNGGYVILAGREVLNKVVAASKNPNSGEIQAPNGSIALGAGNTVNISFDTNRQLSFEVPSAPGTSGKVTNLDGPIADGGTIWLSAQAAARVVAAVINTNGTVQARTASRVKGEIVLEGGDVRIGKLDQGNPQPAELGAMLTISGANSIKGFVKDGITIGGLAATGAIKFATQTGNLTLAGNVTTGDTTPNAITLIAGQNASAGETSGGNIIMQGAPDITTGAGGRVRLYTGSISDSTGLVDFARSGSGNFRYNSTSQSTGLTAPLGNSGKFVIYRERPTLTLIAPSGTFQPGASISVAPRVDGLRNGDSPEQALGSGPRVDVEGPYLNGYLMPGDHVTRVAPQSGGGLGYEVRYVEGKVTITPPKEVTSGQQIANNKASMAGSSQNQSGLSNGLNNSAAKASQETGSGGSGQTANGNSPGKSASDSTAGQNRTNPSGDNSPPGSNAAGPARSDSAAEGSKSALDQTPPEVPAAPRLADKPKNETAPTRTTATEKTDTPTTDAQAERTAANDKPADKPADKPKDERVATQPGASPDKPAATTPATTPAPLMAKAERTSTMSVAAPPPSPVPQEKPPTPRDTADSTDRTLAAASTPAPPKPAPQARRQVARKVEVGPGLVAVQPATRAGSTAGASRDLRISMNGNTGKW